MPFRRNKHQERAIKISKPELIATQLDCRNLSCPLPILKTKKAIGNIGLNEILEMVSTDPGSVADVAAWAKSTGHEVVFQEQKGSEYFYYIKRTK